MALRALGPHARSKDAILDTGIRVPYRSTFSWEQPRGRVLVPSRVGDGCVFLEKRTFRGTESRAWLASYRVMGSSADLPNVTDVEKGEEA